MANNSETLRTKVRYNPEDFPRYFRQLRGLCLKSKGAWILNKLVTNPIAKFENKERYGCPSIWRPGIYDTALRNSMTQSNMPTIRYDYL